MNDPLVSIIIPSYKNVDYLKRAIDSVLKQTYKPIEIVIVDDNDPTSEYRNETENLISSYSSYKSIKYIQNEKNSERSFSRNNGFSNSIGEYVVFLDNDDELFPEKIFNQVSRLETLGKEYVVCYSQYIRKNAGKTVCVGIEKREGDLSFEVLSRDLPIHPGSNLMIRRSALIKTGGFNVQMSYNEDIDLLLKLLETGKIACDDNIGLIVHLHGKGQSFNFEKITNDYMEIEKERIDKLSEEKKKEFYRLIGLQLVKYYIKKPNMVMKTVRSFSIRFTDVVKYFFYLLIRSVTKKAYGFTMRYKIAGNEIGKLQ